MKQKTLDIPGNQNPFSERCCDYKSQGVEHGIQARAGRPGQRKWAQRARLSSRDKQWRSKINLKTNP